MSETESKNLQAQLSKLQALKQTQEQELLLLTKLLLAEMRDIKGDLALVKKQLAEQQAIFNHHPIFTEHHQKESDAEASLTELGHLIEQAFPDKGQNPFIMGPQGEKVVIPSKRYNHSHSMPRKTNQEKTAMTEEGKRGGGVIVPLQHFEPEKINNPVPSQPPAIRHLDQKEKILLQAIERMGFSKAVEGYSSLKLAVPKNHLECLQGSSNEEVQFVTTTQPSPSYFAFEGNNGTYSVIPNLTLIIPPLMIQQTGLDIIYEITPPKPSGPKKIKQILAPARMRFDGQRWSLLAKGVLSFEA